MPSRVHLLVLAIMATLMFIGHGSKTSARDQQALQAEVVVANQATVARQAEANYKRAKLVREVAEYALQEYIQGLYLQAKAKIDGAINPNRATDPQSDMPIVRWNPRTGSKIAEQRADTASRPALSIDRHVSTLLEDIEKARADEASRRAIYEQEKGKLSTPLRPASK